MFTKLGFMSARVILNFLLRYSDFTRLHQTDNLLCPVITASVCLRVISAVCT